MAFDLDDEELKATRIMPCNQKKYRISKTNQLVNFDRAKTYEEFFKEGILLYGTRIVMENGDVFVKTAAEMEVPAEKRFAQRVWISATQWREDKDFKNMRDNWGDCGEIVKILIPDYDVVYEFKRGE